MTYLPKSLGLAAALALSTLAACADAGPQLDARFMDAMVLQRGEPVTVTGSAEPETDITVTLGGAEAQVRTDASGRWEAELPALDAATGLTLRAASSSGASTRADIAVGDVFLCSGQSNIAWPVRLALNPDRELEKPYRTDMRLLQVPHESAVTRQSALPEWAVWKAASRETVTDFSALCYFFGRDWQASEDVPVGLINASWGGSRIEAWISPDALRTAPHLTERLDLLETYVDDPAAGTAAFGATWERWWQGAAATTPWRDGLAEPKPVPGDLRDWKEFGDPELEGFLGMVWHERRVSLTAAQASGAATLSLGGIDEIDTAWVNGAFIGTTFGWGTPREYALPAGTLKEGENIILVNVQNGWAEGGMTGPEDALFLQPGSGDPVPLAGGWTYQKVPPELGGAPQMPWMSVSGLSGMHHGMIAPLAGMTLRGALWYQGESNTGEPETYENFLRLLTADFREQFGADLPMLVIQLPEFGARMMTAGNSGWSSLRDAQRRFVMADDKTGLVVALGAGDEWDIHPPNKQEVARRMRIVWDALLAGPDEPARTGYSPAEAQREGDMVRVALPGVADAYQTSGHTRPVGFMLCDGGGDCAFTDATLSGDTIEIDAPSAEATLVRYCWGDTPVCNLMAPNGTPVTPFELSLD